MKKVKASFLGTIDQFMEEMGALCDKYSFPQWFAAVGEIESNNDEISWQCTGNVKSEGLCDLLEEHAEIMREELSNL